MTKSKAPSARVARNLRRQGVRVLGWNHWGSECVALYNYRRRVKPSADHPVDTVVQHITVTFDSGVLTGDFAEDMRTLERIGYERFRSGISYNLVVDMKTGQVGMGMPLDAKGTHTINDKDQPGYSHDQNYVAIGIAVLGMPSSKLTRKGRRSLVKVLVALMEEGVITTHFDYQPHSFFAFKDCPCDSTRNQMPRIQRRALKRYRRRSVQREWLSRAGVV